MRVSDTVTGCPFGAGCALFGLVLFSLQVSAGELSFRGPFAIRDVPRPVTVHAGDIDGDGKLDLISSSGGRDVIVYFQDDEDRKTWTSVSVPVGASSFFTRAGDFDGDGFDDLAVADGGSSTYIVRSRGDRTFDPPLPIPQARGSRWIAVGDWDHDGNLDLASSNLSSGTLTIFVGDGKFNFRLTGNPPSHREHTLETLDYDGDSNLDLAMGTGLPGIQLHRGIGDGTFVYRTTVPGHSGLLGCVEYISVGDFNNDGLDDLAPTCIDDGTAYAGVSLGTGRYTRILRDAFASGTESSAVGDLNGDGNDDLALVSQGTSFLKVYLGKGDATFEEPLLFGNTGGKPVFLIAEDLDKDGHVDVVSADEGSGSLTIFFGKQGEQFLESTQSVSGYGSARAYAVADLDNDGLPDFFYADVTRALVRVFLSPGRSAPNEPDLGITTAARYSILGLADLNGDGIVDLVSGNTADNAVLTALLDVEGNVSEEQSMPCGDNPKEVATGLLDEGMTVDLVALCASSNEAALSIFYGGGDGTFDAGPVTPTIAGAKLLDTADIDGDGLIDVGVVAPGEIAFHYGVDDGGLSPPTGVIQDASRTFSDITLADLDGDGNVDCLTGSLRAATVRFYKGTGASEFEHPIVLNAGVVPAVLEIVDIDRDGRLDIAGGSRSGRSVALLYNLGEEGFSDPRVEFVGLAFSTFRIIDVNGDQVNDIVSFSATTTIVSIAETDTPPPPPTFRRGDADADGRVILTDAVVILEYLFQEGARPLSCPDAADTNDDAVINLTDPVVVLNYLFQEGAPPAPPGPEECGEDTTEDELPVCATKC